MKPNPRIALLLLLVFQASCNLPVMVTNPTLSPQAISGRPILIDAPANATPTPTPFQPAPPTPTYLPTDFPTLVPTPIPTRPPTPTPTRNSTGDIAKTWDDYPGPTVWPDIEIPPPMGLLAHPTDQINILLLGSDQRPNDGGSAPIRSCSSPSTHPGGTPA